MQLMGVMAGAMAYKVLNNQTKYSVQWGQGYREGVPRTKYSASCVCGRHAEKVTRLKPDPTAHWAEEGRGADS